MTLKSIYHKFAPDFVKELRRDIKIRKQNRDHGRYKAWILANEPGERALKAQREEKFSYEPLISVVMPVYDVKLSFLREAIASVFAQTYAHFELCIAEDHASDEAVRACLREEEEQYADTGKLKVLYREQNGHISRATNSALELAKGAFVAFMDCDDLLSPDALYSVVKSLNENPALDYIYTDEDKITDKGKRVEPHFKSEYAPDTLMSLMYTSHLSVYRREIVDAVGALREGFEGAQDYDLTLRVVERLEKSHIGHIPRVLYHWRSVKGSTARAVETKDYVAHANEQATIDAMARRGLAGIVEEIPFLRQYRPVYDAGEVTVSIVIPSKDNAGVFARCVRSILAVYGQEHVEFNGLRAPRVELITVDNGSGAKERARYEAICAELGIRYIYEPKPFDFSAMCNCGARAANGELLLFLNDDTELIAKESILRMAGHARLPHTGAVGAKLLYPDGRHIQHIGVINIAPGPSHAFLEQRDDAPLRGGRNIADFNYSAVTGACLMVERAKFEEIGGFDENFPIAYNDIDLCFSLAEAGYNNVVRTDARFLHYESLSRGDDRANEEKMERLARDLARLYDKHPAYRGVDPYYSPNFDPYDVNFR